MEWYGAAVRRAALIFQEFPNDLSTSSDDQAMGAMRSRKRKNVTQLKNAAKEKKGKNVRPMIAQAEPIAKIAQAEPIAKTVRITRQTTRQAKK